MAIEIQPSLLPYPGTGIRGQHLTHKYTKNVTTSGSSGQTPQGSAHTMIRCNKQVGRTARSAIRTPVRPRRSRGREDHRPTRLDGQLDAEIVWDKFRFALDCWAKEGKEPRSFVSVRVEMRLASIVAWMRCWSTVPCGCYVAHPTR